MHAMFAIHRHLGAALLAAASLVACGGGGGGEEEPVPPPAPPATPAPEPAAPQLTTLHSSLERPWSLALLSDGQIVGCGVIRMVGPCSRVCQTINGAGQYYPSCVDRPGQCTATVKEVITTALP